MLGACIDIGSNTTRLLVADCDGEQLREIHQERAFTRIGAELRRDGAIGADKIAEVASVVRTQRSIALRLGAESIRCVATAAIRRARNGRQLTDAVVAGSPGLVAELLSAEDEARLAFLGAARMLGRGAPAEVAVVDVGGGSSEVVVGTPPDRISWWSSFPIGSGDIADACLCSDPPSTDELEDGRRRVAAVLGDLRPPDAGLALAVGGSATSLFRLAGPVLDAAAFERSLRLLGSEPAAGVAARFALDVDRVRLLPAGLLILEAIARRLDVPLRIGRGGIREGVLFELASG